ncbi:MAG: phosphate acyltransferase [Lachnospiraceae bacterium]|jgi:glycerol-3-phosphate acyltransferase PlsX
MRKKIIVDICGADAPPNIIASGAVSALNGQDEFDLVLAGPETIVEETLSGKPENIKARVGIIEAEKAVSNYDNPADMVKGKENTSMVKALCALKEWEDIVAMVSAGSTGCLLVGSIFKVGLFGKLMQPALTCALFNTDNEFFCLTDCGANVNSKIKDIVDYARMGSAYMEAVCGEKSPRVGLVNVGREKGKGSDFAKEAFAALETLKGIDFVGNIEGSDILSGMADVVVCDGFTGNLILKTIEAAGLTAASMMGNPEKVVNFFDYNSQGGATFLGTKKIIIKAHGAANENTIEACVRQAWSLEKRQFTQKMEARMN